MLEKSAKSFQPNKNLKPLTNTQWLKENRENYIGQWVALHNGVLVDNSLTKLDLQNKINSHENVRDILVVKVFSEEQIQMFADQRRYTNK